MSFPPSWLTLAPAEIDTTINPTKGIVTERGKVATHVVLPAFDVINLHNNGVSYIGVQFNYTLTGPFAFVKPLNPPVGFIGTLCVRWRYGDVVTRYKLWEMAGTTLYVDDYTSEVIPANFVLEVWKGDLSTQVTNLADINLVTSLLRLPDCDCCNDSVNLDTGDECIPEQVPFDFAFPMDMGTCGPWISN